MELLGFVGITDHEEWTVKALLDGMNHLSLTPTIEELTIQFRRQQLRSNHHDTNAQPTTPQRNLTRKHFTCS